MKKVYCWGTFDRLHEGHLEFFKFAKSKGDYLVAIVISNNNVKENKNKIPKQNQQTRIENIYLTKIVDGVIPAPRENQFEFISSLKPDVFVFGYDQQTKWENDLKKYLQEKGLKTEFYVADEFAKGIHSGDLN
jgi:glycerol-3-phosphate cytidylyltransferase